MMGGRIWVESEPGKGSTFHFTARFGLHQGQAEPAPVRPSWHGAPVQRSGGLRILLAEDNEVNQRLAVHLLQRHGHTVSVAGNGQEALDLLDREPFDVVLMDVQMPEMDGFEATARIRAREQTTGTRLPIIALTAHAMKGDRERCLAAGMDAYVSKPIDEEELLGLLKSLRDEPAPAPPPPVEGGPVVLNREALWQRVGGDQGLLRQVVGLFVRTSGGHVAAIREALVAGDGERLRKAAHTLKGAAATLGAAAVAEVARRLEQSARSDLGEAARELPALEQELRVLRPHLDELVEEALAAR